MFSITQNLGITVAESCYNNELSIRFNRQLVDIIFKRISGVKITYGQFYNSALQEGSNLMDMV